MTHLYRPLAIGALGLVLAAAPVFAEHQQTAPTPAQTPVQTTQSTQSAQPCPPASTATPAQTTQATQPAQATPLAPATQSTQTSQASQPCTQAQQTPAQPKLRPGDPGYNPPVVQKDDPNIKAGSKQDVEAIGQRNVGKGLDFFSIEHDIAEGKAMSQEVERTAKLVDDPVIIEYVNRVGQNLVNNSDAKVPFTIKVIDSDSVNAFALPGGFFYVYTGLILHAQEESELAGVMAHEIAHVALRHGSKNETKGTIAQLAMIPAMILLPGGWAGYGIYEGMQFAIPMTFLKFSRDQEREADYYGLQYMYKSGYDPNAYVTFFERILADEKRSPGSIPKVFNDHPPTPERIDKAEKEIAEILPSRDNYVVTTSEFDTVKARLIAFERRKKPIGGKKDSPTLRTKTEQQKDGQAKDGTQQGGDDSDRPVLKKRPDGSGGNNN
jgi:predicted Zn-dependent protease